MPISLVARGRRRKITKEFGGLLFRWSIKLEGSRGVIIGLFLFFRCSIRATEATFIKHNI